MKKIIPQLLRPFVLTCLLFGWVGVTSAQENLPQVKHLIDTHIHLYDTERPKGVYWPRPDDKALYAPHMPPEFHRVAEPAGVTGVVVVEASSWTEDNQWVLDLVKEDDFFVGLVAWLDTTAKDFPKQLRELAKDSRVVGIRTKSLEAVDVKNPAVLKNLKALSRQKLTLDILANGVSVEKMDEIATALPRLTIVVNHATGLKIDGKEAEAKWSAAVKRLSKHKNVYCKVSGLYQRSLPQPASKDIEFYRSVLDVLWNNFGSERLIYGSNWPVTKKSGDYASFVHLVHDFFEDKGQEACELYYWGNASRAYRLGLK